VTVARIGLRPIAGNIMAVRQFGASGPGFTTGTVPGAARIDCVFQVSRGEGGRRGSFIRREIQEHRTEKVRFALEIAV